MASRAGQLQSAVFRVLGGVVAGLVIVAGLFDGSLRAAVVVGLVVGIGYAVAAAVLDRLREGGAAVD